MGNQFARCVEELAAVFLIDSAEEHAVCPSLGTAKLFARMAELGVTGPQVLPSGGEAAMGLLDELEARHEMACARLRELVESRTSDPDTQDKVFGVLERWFVLGRSRSGAKSPRHDTD